MTIARRIEVALTIIAAVFALVGTTAYLTGRSFLVGQRVLGAGQLKYLECHYFMFDTYTLQVSGQPSKCPFFGNMNANDPNALPPLPR